MRTDHSPKVEWFARKTKQKGSTISGKQHQNTVINMKFETQTHF
jgi:hypothetical protein